MAGNTTLFTNLKTIGARLVKECPNCHEKFELTSREQVCCSKRCSRSWRWKRPLNPIVLQHQHMYAFSDETRRKMSESAVRRAARQKAERVASGWVPKPKPAPLTDAQQKMMRTILSQPSRMEERYNEPNGRPLFHAGWYDDMPPVKTDVVAEVFELVDYRAYIQSEEWREKARAAKRRAGWRCQVCNSDHELDAHHRTYDNLGREKPNDITVLCRKCHTLYHKNGKIEKS